MVYQYKGSQTVDRELDYLRTKAEHAEKSNRELVAENMVLKAENQRLRKTNQSLINRLGTKERLTGQLTETVRQLRKDKRMLQSRVIGLKKVRPYKVYEEPQPVNEVVEITDFSGPRGLLAAVEESKLLRRTRNAA